MTSEPPPPPPAAPPAVPEAPATTGPDTAAGAVTAPHTATTPAPEVTPTTSPSPISSDNGVTGAQADAAAAGLKGLVPDEELDESIYYGAYGGRTGKILSGVLAFLSVAVLAVGLGVGIGLGKQTTADTQSSVPVYSSINLGDQPGPTYFIAADQVSWNYAPSGRNLCYDNETASKMLAPGTTRVGGTFAKAQYRLYTDSSFKTLMPVPPEWEHLGNVGPVIRASVGDVIRIVFRNNLPFAANMVPSGGLVNWDGAGYKSFRVQSLPPGLTDKFLWKVTEAAGPANDSTVSSRMWLYSSTADPQMNDNAGLVGPIIITAKDAPKASDGRPADVDREVVTIFQVVNERMSSMFMYTDPELNEGVSYTKMAINGYTWCNMPASALTMKVGQKVRWHVASLGDGTSLHNYHWHGHGVELAGHHVDQFTAIPGASYSVNMHLDEPGAWMFHCHVNLHMDGGMVDLYRVEGDPLPYETTGRERIYYVAAEEVEWSYSGPNNTNMCGDEPLPYDAEMTDSSPEGNQFVNGPSLDPVRLGYKYTKTLFREYSDGSFTTLKERSEEDAYLGLIGPILRASVGDTIKVVLLNRANMNVSMHPHGVRYAKAHEGTLYEDGTGPEDKQDDLIMPGETYTYVWQVPDRTGPGPRDPSSMLWMYHGHLDETADTYAGLAGAIIVTSQATAISLEDPRPNDVDKEVIIFFTVVDEAKSAMFMENLATRLGDDGALAAQLAANETEMKALIEDPDFAEHMLKHGINGFMYCNMPKLYFMQGDKVRLHVMVLGTLEDMHTPNMGGPRFDYNGQHTDSIQISPGGMVSANVLMTSPGDYELHCRVGDHVASGMRAKYSVEPNPAALATPLSGVTRTYYIQAEPVDWDYAPKGYKRCTDVSLKYVSDKYINPKKGMGSKYRKAVFREYTDDSFTVRKDRPDYMGIMGPMLIVEPGDNLVVVLRNTINDLPDPFPINIAPGGGLVVQGGEGENCAEVAPGEQCVYRWLVPDSAGPASGDFNTAVYGYTSTVDVVTAPIMGLVGAVVVAGRGELQPGAQLPKGVDHMVPLYWQVINEEVSPYFDANLATTGANLTAIDSSNKATNFHEGNRKHSINGYLYCNLPNLSFKKGVVVRWVLVAYGTEGDMHSPMFTGQPVTVDHTGYSTLASLMPSIARVADMTADDPGTWLLACGVQDHYYGGMLAQFTITK